MYLCKYCLETNQTVAIDVHVLMGKSKEKNIRVTRSMEVYHGSIIRCSSPNETSYQDVYCCTLRDRLLTDLDSAICTPTVV